MSFIFVNSKCYKMRLSDRLFRKKVEKLYPKIAEEVVQAPTLSDISIVPELYRRFIEIERQPSTKGPELYEFRAIFIGVALKMFDPDYIGGYKKKVMDGLSEELSKLFGIEKSTCSWWMSQVAGRIRIYKEMAEKVQEVFDLLEGSFND